MKPYTKVTYFPYHSVITVCNDQFDLIKLKRLLGLLDTYLFQNHLK